MDAAVVLEKEVIFSKDFSTSSILIKQSVWEVPTCVSHWGSVETEISKDVSVATKDSSPSEQDFKADSFKRAITVGLCSWGIWALYWRASEYFSSIGTEGLIIAGVEE